MACNHRMAHCFGAVMALSSHGFGECCGGKAKPMQVHSCTVWGLKAPAVTVEVNLANGLPQFALVGLADTEVREARERVLSAFWRPANK